MLPIESVGFTCQNNTKNVINKCVIVHIFVSKFSLAGWPSEADIPTCALVPLPSVPKVALPFLNFNFLPLILTVHTCVGYQNVGNFFSGYKAISLKF